MDVLLTKAARRDEPRELVLRLPAEPGRLSALRRRLDEFLTGNNVPEADICDLTVAVSEAAANAIEHPVDPAEASITVEAAVTGDSVLVTVRDTGRWRTRESAGFRGRGLALIGAFTDLSVVRSDTGTAVTLRRLLSP